MVTPGRAVYVHLQLIHLSSFFQLYQVISMVIRIDGCKQERYILISEKLYALELETRVQWIREQFCRAVW